MRRKAKLFVRPLTTQQRRQLDEITQSGKQRVRTRRAIIVAASADGRAVPLISRSMRLPRRYVRQVIEDFNEHGMAALAPTMERRRDGHDVAPGQ